MVAPVKEGEENLIVNGFVTGENRSVPHARHGDNPELHENLKTTVKLLVLQSNCEAGGVGSCRDSHDSRSLVVTPSALND